MTEPLSATMPPPSPAVATRWRAWWPGAVALLAAPMLLSLPAGWLPSERGLSRLLGLLDLLSIALCLVAFLLSWRTRRSGQPVNLAHMGVVLLGAAVLESAGVVAQMDAGTALPVNTAARCLSQGADTLVVAGLLLAAALPRQWQNGARATGAVLGIVAASTVALALLALQQPAPAPSVASALPGVLTLVSAAVAGLAWRRREGIASQARIAWAALLITIGLAVSALVDDRGDVASVISHLYRLAGLVVFCAVLFEEGVQAPYARLAEMEMASEESRQRYRQLFRSSPDGLIVVDAAGRISRANPAAASMFGWTDADLVGQLVEVLLPEGAGERHARLRCSYLNHPATREMGSGSVLHGRRRNGEEFPVEIALVPQTETGDRSTLCIVRDVSARQRLEASLVQQAMQDSLTGLPNRRAFQKRVVEAIAAASRSDQCVGLLFLDLDDFKGVNDTLGHGTGDALLCEVALRLRQVLRGADLLARMGGDEFAIVLSQVRGAEDVGHVADKLLRLVTSPITICGHRLSVGVSIGITLYPTDGSEPEDLLRNADLAMYRAKSDGRRCWRFYHPDMNVRVQRRLRMERDLRTALEQQEFHLVYQPRVQLHDGDISGVEALLRWTHPEHGPVGPDEFIPVAEEMGLIGAIGDWVLDAVCRQAAEWAAAGVPEVQLAVNVSAHQLRDDGFAERIAGTLARHGLPACRLELEITETALMENTARAARMLQALVAVGVSIAVDDFGTGYSSLAYLRSFPLHVLKLDRTFVERLTEEHNDRVLAATIVLLGHALGLRVTAEGVEHADQAAYLASQHCDEAQGYYFSRPLLPDAFAQLLTEQRHHGAPMHWHASVFSQCAAPQREDATVGTA